jgi:signal peptidase I
MILKSLAGWMETIKTVVFAVLIAFVVRAFGYEPFNIPSGSMIPTLLVGDYLFVSKFSYGYSRYSFPWGVVPLSDRVWFSEPERGDVAVFRLPRDTSIDYIKRLIGLPGDRIQVIDGVLLINGEPVPRERIEDFVVPGNGRRIAQYIETLPNGVSYRVLDERPTGSLDNTIEYVVPEGHYFAMGDNRDNSSDSRASVGFVPAENLIGRADVTFFSIAGETRIWEAWDWRFGRFFRGID